MNKRTIFCFLVYFKMVIDFFVENIEHSKNFPKLIC